MNTPKDVNSIIATLEAEGAAKWRKHEIEYWEGVYDTLKAQYLKLIESHDRWKEGHENVARQLDQFKEWHSLLEIDRDRYRDWDDQKRKRVEELTTRVQQLAAEVETWRREHAEVEILLKARQKELQQIQESWSAEQAKLEAIIQQWVVWHRDVEVDRDRYRQWDGEKSAALERLQDILAQKNKDLDEMHHWVESLLTNPFRYFSQYMKRHFR